MKVIKTSNFPSKLPIWEGLTLWLFLDRIHVGPVILGVIWTVFVVMAALLLYGLLNEETIDLFKDK